MLQTHAAVPLPPLSPEIRQVRRALLRRTDFEQFGYTDNCPRCANGRAGLKQAADHSEHCRSRLEAILVTTTEGHERLERARHRFAFAAKEREDEEPQRKRHRLEGEGAPSASGVRSNFQEGSSSGSGSALPRPPAPPLLEKTTICTTEFGTGDRSDRCDRGTTGRVKEALLEHPKAPQAADSSSSSESSTALKWDWWMCVRFSVEIPRGLRGNP